MDVGTNMKGVGGSDPPTRGRGWGYQPVLGVAPRAPSDEKSVGRSPPSPFVSPFVRPKPFVIPLVRPKPLVRPLVRPRPFVRPFVRPSPFVSPFVRPRPFVRPFVRPSPFVRPFVRPRRPFVRPRSPFVLPAFRAPRRPRRRPFVRPFFEGVASVGFAGRVGRRSSGNFGGGDAGLSTGFARLFSSPSSSSTIS